MFTRNPPFINNPLTVFSVFFPPSTRCVYLFSTSSPSFLFFSSSVSITPHLCCITLLLPLLPHLLNPNIATYTHRISYRLPCLPLLCPPIPINLLVLALHDDLVCKLWGEGRVRLRFMFNDGWVRTNTTSQLQQCQNNTDEWALSRRNP